MQVLLCSTSSVGSCPGEAGLGGGAGLEAHTSSVFSVMAEPTSAWAWGGHMDPEDGMLTCGREQSYRKERPQTSSFNHPFDLTELFTIKAP